MSSKYPVCFEWFESSVLAVSIVPGGGLDACRDAFYGWCDSNRDSVNPCGEGSTVSSWLARLTELDRANYPELFEVSPLELYWLL